MSTPEFIEELHKDVLEAFPGVEGVLHPNLLHTVIARPKHYVTYEDCNLHKVCAVMAHTIAQVHPFTDANKRTALLTIIVVYRLNGVSLNYSAEINGEFTTFLLWIVQRNPSVDDIALQLQDIVERHVKSGIEKALESISDFFPI